jgi:hypothetical protein
MIRAICAGVFWLATALCVAQSTRPVADLDSDRDGLSDTLEAKLLDQFQPQWMVSKTDCSVRPARFEAMLQAPTAVADDGTVYGQAFRSGSVRDEIELHYYHLWRLDCGQMGHPLDAEHVAVLLRKVPGDDEHGWRAVYWYAAAHEDTVCDASQITRASTLKDEEKGATVWISTGKHASFLNEELCTHGCGGDRCAEMERMKSPGVVNLGELSWPSGGAVWVKSLQWPLAAKMKRSDFNEARIALLERLPDTDIGWANPSKRPAQAAIYGGNSAVNGIAVGGRSTDTALTLANDKTSGALGKAQRNTGNALTKSYKNVRKAIGSAAKNTGEALGVDTKKQEPDDNSSPR